MEREESAKGHGRGDERGEEGEEGDIGVKQDVRQLLISLFLHQ